MTTTPRARAVMVLGTTSGAGKSWLTTALCRYYARQGLKVVPFKAQNMSNNARVVAPTLFTAPSASCNALPPEGALRLRPGEGEAPTLFTAPSAACNALPPEGALRLRPGEGEAPTLFTAPSASCNALPPEGALRLRPGKAGSAAPACEDGDIWQDGDSGEDGEVRANLGGEIGSAQYFQALAARAVPEVRMNPLLLKPEKDTQSQVVLMGQVHPELSRMAWRGRSAAVWPVVAQALDGLMAENDVVVIEGAGSPAEINLRDSDIVNMRVALHADAACLLVTDIDRGGAFAHLYGTWAMLDEAERRLIRGFVLNKFRGDAALLAPGPQMLQSMTGVPTVAVLPMWWQHGLPEEDGVFDDRSTHAGAVTRTVAVVAYPRISNLDEFQPLKNVPGLHLTWVRSPSGLAGLSADDWVILPGSKHTSGDLAWLRAQGLDQAIAGHAARGGAVLGICGGLQMLGEALIDTHGIDGNAPGLGLLPVATVFEPAKTVRQRDAVFGDVTGAWSALAGVGVTGYEIHHGQTAPHPALAAAGQPAHAVLEGGLAWQNGSGNVLGLYLHGLFEDPRVLRALFGAETPTLDAVFDGLADYIGEHFGVGVLDGLIEPR